MRIAHAADPFAHSFVDGILEDAGARGHSVDLRAQEFHTVYVESLADRILFAHEYLTFKAQEGCRRRRRYAVLAGTGFGDNPGLAHLFG